MSREITAKKLVRYGSMILFFVVLVGYATWSSRDLLFGIRLTTVGITDGMTASDPVLTFSGVASHARSIVINGRVVPLAQNGSWTDSIALFSGYNTVTIATTDKFNRTTTRDYRVYYK